MCLRSYTNDWKEILDKTWQRTHFFCQKNGGPKSIPFLKYRTNLPDPLCVVVVTFFIEMVDMKYLKYKLRYLCISVSLKQIALNSDSLIQLLVLSFVKVPKTALAFNLNSMSVYSEIKCSHTYTGKLFKLVTELWVLNSLILGYFCFCFTRS